MFPLPETASISNVCNPTKLKNIYWSLTLQQKHAKIQGGDHIRHNSYLPMILCISWPYTEDGGGSHIVRVLVTAEADDMGPDTLSDVLIYTIQLCGPGNLLILQEIDTYHTSVYNYMYNVYA